MIPASAGAAAFPAPGYASNGEEFKKRNFSQRRLDSCNVAVYIQWRTELILRKNFSMKHEILILVNSMEECRYFYRETLQLGEPVTDSSELAEFKLGENVSLVLEECLAKYLEHTSGATSWVIETGNFDEICGNLKKLGMLSGDEFIRKGRRAQKAHDPEGNPFILTGKIN